MKTFHAASCAAIALSMLVLPGCGKSDEDPAPANVVEINGTVIPIVDATVYYGAGWRRLALTDENGFGVFLDFDGTGDPAVTANQIPSDHWTTLEPAVSDPPSPIFISVGFLDAEGWRDYGAASTYTGSVDVGGTPGTTLTVDGSFEFTSGSGDTFQVNYSGPYEWVQD